MDSAAGPRRGGGEHNLVQTHETKYNTRFEITLGFKLHIPKRQAELSATRECDPENLKVPELTILNLHQSERRSAAPPGVKEPSVPTAPKSNWQSANGHFSLLSRIPSMAPALGEPATNVGKRAVTLTTDFSRT